MKVTLNNYNVVLGYFDLSETDLASACEINEDLCITIRNYRYGFGKCRVKSNKDLDTLRRHIGLPANDRTRLLAHQNLTMTDDIQVATKWGDRFQWLVTWCQKTCDKNLYRMVQDVWLKLLWIPNIIHGPNKWYLYAHFIIEALCMVYNELVCQLSPRSRNFDWLKTNAVNEWEIHFSPVSGPLNVGF